MGETRIIVENLSDNEIMAIARKVAEIQSCSITNETSFVPKEADIFFSVEEVATILKCTPWTIRQHIKKGLLLATKRGKSWLISEENFKKYTTNEQ